MNYLFDWAAIHEFVIYKGRTVRIPLYSELISDESYEYACLQI